MAGLAVVVVSHDSAAELPATLAAVRDQLQGDDELVVVDCGSSDGSPEVAERCGAQVLRRANLGFAGGANAGAAATSAELVLFLNPDATPLPGALDALRSAPASWGLWQAAVLLPDGGVNTAGNPVHFLGFAWAGDGPLDAPRDVPSASGAALCVRRACWQQLGGFDETYFMYGEDLDLSLRARLAGWGVGVVPAARVEHAYDFVKGDYKWFGLERNRARTVLSTYPSPLLALLAPALLLFELALLPAALAGGWLRPKLRAQAAVVRELGAIRARRARVQATARIGAREFAAALTASLDSPYLAGARRLPMVPAVLEAYWSLVRRLLR